MNLEDVLHRLYESEINCKISCFWDGRWDVQLGDDLNGYVAETNVENVTEIGGWLHEMALIHFPKSGYAKASLKALPQ